MNSGADIIVVALMVIFVGLISLVVGVGTTNEANTKNCIKYYEQLPHVEVVKLCKQILEGPAK